MKKTINVVAAIIIKDNSVFCARRDEHGEVGLKWEFPGGKIEANESHEEALAREIQEELASKIEVKGLINHTYHEYNTFNINLYAYRCLYISGDLKSSVHIDTKWVRKDYLFSLDWAEADKETLKKIVELDYLI